MYRVLTCLLCIVLPALAFGQAATYGLADCVRLGLAQSTVAANARRDQAIADAQFDQALSQALPSFSVSAGYTRLDELTAIDFGGGESQEFGTLDNYSVGAEVSQLLYSSGKVKAALRAAGTSKRYAEQVRAETDSGLVRDVRRAFYGILLARAAVEVNRESVAQLQQNAAQVKERLAHETASEFDHLTAQVRLANEEPALIAARNNLDLAMEDLRRRLGLDDAPFEIDGELAYAPVTVDLDALLAVALDSRPAIVGMQNLVKLRGEAVRSARADGLPEVRASARYDGANAYQFVSFEDEWEWHWQASLSLEWALWDGGLTRGVVREKRLDKEKTEADLEEMRRLVRLEVRSAWLEMRRAGDAVQAARGNVALAERALGIAKVRYEQGLATYLEFTDSNLALSRARLTWHTALHAHSVALADLQYACGVSDERFAELTREREPEE